MKLERTRKLFTFLTVPVHVIPKACVKSVSLEPVTCLLTPTLLAVRMEAIGGLGHFVAVAAERTPHPCMLRRT